jgi:hypothetical protein
MCVRHRFVHSPSALEDNHSRGLCCLSFLAILPRVLRGDGMRYLSRLLLEALAEVVCSASLSIGEVKSNPDINVAEFSPYFTLVGWFSRGKAFGVGRYRI